MAGDCLGIANLFKSDAQKKEDRKRQVIRQQDQQRQKNANGLLELALNRPFSRNSFTASDPGRFYVGHTHAHGGDDPWKKQVEVPAKDASDGKVGGENR